jgi:hypothetical protein
VLAERVVLRLNAIPPLEEARLGELIGIDIVVLNCGALAMAILSGQYMYVVERHTGRCSLALAPYADACGTTLGPMTARWASPTVTSSVITF